MTRDRLSPAGPPPVPREAARIALAYVTLFTLTGVHLPYWPVWLAHRGMDPDEMGILLGVLTWARVATPWAARQVDSSRGAARILSVLALFTLLCFAGFGLVSGFAAMLALSILLGLAMAPISPLIDGVSLGAAAAGRLDYGRVRLWGSASFVLASAAAGFLLDGRSPSLILAALMVSSASLCVATRFLPREPPLSSASAAPAGMRALLRQPRMGTFLAAGAFLQASHAVVYTFGTHHWQAVGVSESVIGWLWAWGVVVEVCLFAVGGRLLTRFHATGFLVIAGLGGMVRWPLLAFLESPGLLLATQTLHACTFAAMHLGSMSWIRDNVPPSAVQRTTALYVAVSTGMALGLAMPLAGFLYERLAGGAYFAMAASSTVGLVFALRLFHRRAR